MLKCSTWVSSISCLLFGLSVVTRGRRRCFVLYIHILQQHSLFTSIKLKVQGRPTHLSGLVCVVRPAGNGDDRVHVRPTCLCAVPAEVTWDAQVQFYQHASVPCLTSKYKSGFTIKSWKHLNTFSLLYAAHSHFWVTFFKNPLFRTRRANPVSM